MVRDQWSPELIMRLDWLRITGVIRAIAECHGCELGQTVALEDGAVLFGMVEQPGTAKQRRALVRMTGWNEWVATAETVFRFVDEVKRAVKSRGILIAPSGFSRAALVVARDHGIEVVDAEKLCEVLKVLPVEVSDSLLAAATAGDFMTPTCPVCLDKLARCEVRETEAERVRVFKESGLTNDCITCRKLEVVAGCEAVFLHEVRAEEMRIAGHADGEFVCTGRLILEKGGVLTGKVAARSVEVREGGELRGEFRILDGEQEALIREATRWEWRCVNEFGKEGCRRVVFVPHG